MDDHAYMYVKFEESCSNPSKASRWQRNVALATMKKPHNIHGTSFLRNKND